MTNQPLEWMLPQLQIGPFLIYQASFPVERANRATMQLRLDGTGRYLQHAALIAELSDYLEIEKSSIAVLQEELLEHSLQFNVQIELPTKAAVQLYQAIKDPPATPRQTAINRLLGKKTDRSSPRQRVVYALLIWVAVAVIWGGCVLFLPSAVWRDLWMGVAILLGISNLVGYIALRGQSSALRVTVYSLIVAATLVAFTQYQPIGTSAAERATTFFIGMGILLIYLLIVLLLAPVWVLEIRSGEVFYYRKYWSHSEDFDMPECPVAPEATPDPSTDSLLASIESLLRSINAPPDFRAGFIKMLRQLDLGVEGLQELHTILQSEVRAITRDTLARLFAGFDQRISAKDLEKWAKTPDEQSDKNKYPRAKWKWIGLLDEVWRIWRVQDLIMINRTLPDIITNDGGAFDVTLDLGVRFNPKNLRADSFRIKIPVWRDPEKIKEVLVGVLIAQVHRAAMRFFGRMDNKTAQTRGQGDFEDRLPAYIEELNHYLGLTLLSLFTFSRPIVSEKQKEAARTNLTAKMVAADELQRFNQMLDTAMHGAPQQLVIALAALDQADLKYLKSLNVPNLNDLTPDEVNSYLKFKGENTDKKELTNIIVEQLLAPPSEEFEQDDYDDADEYAETEDDEGIILDGDYTVADTSEESDHPERLESRAARARRNLSMPDNGDPRPDGTGGRRGGRRPPTIGE